MATASITTNDDTSESDVESLSVIFDKGLDLFNVIMNGQEPTNSPDVQVNIKKCMKQFEQCTRLVSLAGIFSTNEGIEEVSTNDLKYFLLPALLGGLSLKLTTGERRDIVDVAEIYYKDFVTRCKQYGLTNYEINKPTTTEKETTTKTEKTDFEKLSDSVNTRANKIQRFKEQKELKSKLQELKTNLQNEHVDEEIKRSYFLTMIKLFILESVDELHTIDMEKPILEHMANIKKDDKTLQQPKRPPPAPLKPIIITRDEVQKAVYGAGYPSLPTMTVQEFYDKRVADGVFPDPNKKKPANAAMSLQEATLAGINLNDDDREEADKEKLEEEDDDEYLMRMRAKDEFKDEHRRGWGNRMNRS